MVEIDLQGVRKVVTPKSKYGGKGEIVVKYGRKSHTSILIDRLAQRKQHEKQVFSTFRRTTRRKVIKTTLLFIVTSKSKYGGKGRNPRKIRAKVLLTLRVSGRKVLFTFRAQIDK